MVSHSSKGEADLLDFHPELESEHNVDDDSAESGDERRSGDLPLQSEAALERARKQEILIRASTTPKPDPCHDDAEAERKEQQQESDRIINRARDYQQELFERAKEENVIAVLDTGTGKTLIAAMLIRHVLEEEVSAEAQGEPLKFVFFLCNSVALAHQQARFLRNNISANVIALVGDGKDDLWKRIEWDRILVENKVVVCTPDVLYQSLSHHYVAMSQISLLIFDEGTYITEILKSC